MSFMIEVYYRKPEDQDRERRIVERTSRLRGLVTDRDDLAGPAGNQICLTIEFWTLEDAETASTEFREAGERVDGPSEYGSTAPGEA